MKFNELTHLVTEGIGEDAAEKFKETFAGDTAPEFISFRYKNKQGEIADRVVNIGLGYQQMQEKNTQKLEKAKTNIEELKNELRPILQKKTESTGGLFSCSVFLKNNLRELRLLRFLLIQLVEG